MTLGSRIYNDENLGFGRANNKGIEIAQGRNILFLNSDTLLRNNAIKILSDYLDAHSEVGACGGNLYNQYGKPTHSFHRRLPSALDELDGFFSGRLYKLRVGGFDERFFMYYEDTELCRRISKTGLAIVSCPEAEITHYAKDTLSQTTRNYLKESRLIYFGITHSRFYCSILHCSRVLLSVLKQLSPNADTRKRWRSRMHYYRPLVK